MEECTGFFTVSSTVYVKFLLGFGYHICQLGYCEMLKCSPAVSIGKLHLNLRINRTLSNILISNLDLFRGEVFEVIGVCFKGINQILIRCFQSLGT